MWWFDEEAVRAARLASASTRNLAGLSAIMDSKKIDIAINVPPPLDIDPRPKGTGTVTFAVAGYACCSSLMLVVNKVRF